MAKRMFKNVVRSVNVLRKNGLKPISKMPTGIPQDEDFCPIAIATKMSVTPTNAFDEINGEKYLLNQTLQRFVHNFDVGMYPELIKRGYR